MNRLDIYSIGGQLEQHKERLTCVLQPPVFTDGSWWLQVGPVMKEHLHSWRFYLGWSIGYDIEEILHMAQTHEGQLSYRV